MYIVISADYNIINNSKNKIDAECLHQRLLDF